MSDGKLKPASLSPKRTKHHTVSVQSAGASAGKVSTKQFSKLVEELEKTVEASMKCKHGEGECLATAKAVAVARKAVLEAALGKGAGSE